jgi:hypothetical protein
MQGADSAEVFPNVWELGYQNSGVFDIFGLDCQSIVLISTSSRSILVEESSSRCRKPSERCGSPPCFAAAFLPSGLTPICIDTSRLLSHMALCRRRL